MYYQRPDHRVWMGCDVSIVRQAMVCGARDFFMMPAMPTGSDPITPFSSRRKKRLSSQDRQINGPQGLVIAVLPAPKEA
jgi:hypothetical protein